MTLNGVMPVTLRYFTEFTFAKKLLMGRDVLNIKAVRCGIVFCR